MSKEIVVNTNVVSKKAPDFKSIQQKAVAGISEAELIERHIIGEHSDDEEGEENKESA